jgi:hypothetical protein
MTDIMVGIPGETHCGSAAVPFQGGMQFVDIPDPVIE